MSHSRPRVHQRIHLYRYELLFIALMLYIFDKVFFVSQAIYTQYVWPVNMVLLGVASLGIFRDGSWGLRVVKNILFVAVTAVPFLAETIFTSPPLAFLGLLVYLLFYVLIFTEVMRQITRRDEVTWGIIYGSLSGFLLLAIIASFSFLLVNHFLPGSFKGIEGVSVPDVYNQISYFSLITLTTIGYGDITPANDSARLLAAFWGLIGQFYMVAVVGIIIARYTDVGTKH